MSNVFYNANNLVINNGFVKNPNRYYLEEWFKLVPAASGDIAFNKNIDFELSGAGTPTSTFNTLAPGINILTNNTANNNSIIEPHTKARYSIYSNEGIAILKKMIKLYQSGGANLTRDTAVNKDIPTNSYYNDWYEQLNQKDKHFLCESITKNDDKNDDKKKIPHKGVCIPRNKCLHRYFNGYGWESIVKVYKSGHELGFQDKICNLTETDEG